MSRTEINLRSYPSRFIPANGVRLHCVEAGPPDGKLVILLHGYPEFHFGWRNQITPLAEAGYHVIVPDLRGYNLSDKPRDLSAYRLDVIAQDIVALITAFGREKAFLVGHDWGGVAAWVSAVLFPEQVERLAVLNAPYPPVLARTIFRHPEQLLKSAYIYYFQIPGLPEAMLRNDDWQLLVEMMRRSSRPGTFSDEDFERYRQAWWRPGAMTGMLNWYRAFIRRPVALPPDPQLNMPVLLLWGVQDIALGRELAEACISLCSRGTLVYFEEATHWLQHEEPAQVNEHLLGFFGSPDQG